jgi:hypothetical protein
MEFKKLFKTSRGRILIGVAAIAILLPISKAMEPRRIVEKPSFSMSSVQSAFNRIGADSGTTPTLIDWRNGKAILMSEVGWKGMADSDRAAILAYAKATGMKAVLVGRSTATGITLDKAVWGE